MQKYSVLLPHDNAGSQAVSSLCLFENAAFSQIRICENAVSCLFRFFQITGGTLKAAGTQGFPAQQHPLREVSDSRVECVWNGGKKYRRSRNNGTNLSPFFYLFSTFSDPYICIFDLAFNGIQEVSGSIPLVLAHRLHFRPGNIREPGQSIGEKLLQRLTIIIAGFIIGPVPLTAAVAEAEPLT